MWNVQAKVIPVIRGVTGTTSKSRRQYLSNIMGKHEIKEMRKTAILGTVGSADVKVQNTHNTVHPRNMACFRHVIVNTVHKGDNSDDDDNDDNDNSSSLMC
jgi:hypothetical protein